MSLADTFTAYSNRILGTDCMSVCCRGITAKKAYAMNSDLSVYLVIRLILFHSVMTFKVDWTLKFE